MEYIKLSYHHLNFEDRTALMLESRKEGFSARKFAELIKRHPSTIYRELKRNSINDVYQAQYASDNTFARRRRGHRKLKIDSILWKFIVEAIRCLWSPQQIAKFLKVLFFNVSDLNISKLNGIYNQFFKMLIVNNDEGLENVFYELIQTEEDNIYCKFRDYSFELLSYIE